MTCWLIVEGVGILLNEECCRRHIGLLWKEVIMMESSSVIGNGESYEGSSISARSYSFISFP